MLPTDFPFTKTLTTHDRGYNLTCKVTGHPKPKVTWFKDNSTISMSSGFYRIVTTETPIKIGGFNVTTTLYWEGKFGIFNLLVMFHVLLYENTNCPS